MDDTQTIDSFVDELTGALDGDGGSSPSPEQAAPETVPQDTTPVAPEGGTDAEDSSSAVDPGMVAEAPAAPETPQPPAVDPALTARLEAIEAEARAAQERAERAENVLREAQQRAMERQEQMRLQQQRDEWTARAVQIEQISDPDMQKREAARLVAEVEQARAMDAQRIIQQREQLIAQREQESESTAAIGAAFYQSIRNDPTLTEADKTRLIDNARHLSTYPNPTAQQAALEREKQVVDAAIVRAKAEWEKAQAAQTQAKVQERIAKDTDLVGSGAGSAGGGFKTNDEFVDSLFP